MTHSSKALIRLENISKVFHTDEVETHALDNVNLEIADGEYVSIAGPSGSGKTTLLSILGLLDTPTSGEYMLAGQPVANLKEFFKDALHDWLDKLRDKSRNVAAIAVQKHYDRTFRQNPTRACRARSSVTPRRSYNTRSSFTRPLGCAIGAAIINDNHFGGRAGCKAFANHAGDRFLLV